MFMSFNNNMTGATNGPGTGPSKTRNETQRNETWRNETKPGETKRNEKVNRNETKS